MNSFSVKTLSTVTMLSTALLLSACNGNSDSSGGKYEFKDKGKIDVLNGNWKSNCQQSNQGSAILYLTFKTIDKDNLMMDGKVQLFPNKNCTEDTFVVKTKKESKKITRKDLEADKSIKIIDDNHWKNTDDNEIFTRISTSEYNRIK